MGQLVAELRKVYVTAKAEAAPILEDILGEGSVQSLDRETTETEAVGEGRNLVIFFYCSLKSISFGKGIHCLKEED